MEINYMEVLASIASETGAEYVAVTVRKDGKTFNISLVDDKFNDDDNDVK